VPLCAAVCAAHVWVFGSGNVCSFSPDFPFQATRRERPKTPNMREIPLPLCLVELCGTRRCAARPHPTPRDKLLNEPSRSIVPLSSSNKEDVLFCTNTKYALNTYNKKIAGLVLVLLCVCSCYFDSRKLQFLSTDQFLRKMKQVVQAT